MSPYVVAKLARDAGLHPSTFPSALATFPHLHDRPAVGWKYDGEKWADTRTGELRDAPPLAGAEGAPGEVESVGARVCEPRSGGPPDPLACLRSINSRGVPDDPEDAESPQMSARAAAPESAPKKRAQVEITRGAGVVKVQREHEQHGTEPPERSEGDIVGFSRASARRLQVRMAKVRKDHQPVFGHVTYPDLYAWSKERLKGHIENLWDRLRRRFPGISFVWKVEFERRKSGAMSEGWQDENGETVGCFMPHLHFLIFRDDPGEWTEAQYEAVRRAVEKHWHAIVWRDADRETLQQMQDNLREEARDLKADHQEAGTRTERIRSRRGTLHYVSEYIADPEDSIQHSIGRYWGIYGRKNLPLGETVAVAVADRTARKMMRAVMKAERQSYEGLPLVRTHLCENTRPWDVWVREALFDEGIPEERFSRWVEYISTGQNRGESPQREDMERPTSFGEWERRHLN
jgi:hypothetical protein